MGSYVTFVDAVAGAPSYTGRMLRQTVAVLVPGATSTRPLGGLSATRRGIGSPISVTTTQVTVTPFSGQIDAETANQAGVYLFSFDSNQVLSINAAQSNPRIDIVCVQISDPAESDGTSTPGVAITYTAGTAAASPTQPATPARSMLLGVINVPATGGGSPTVTWVAPQLPGNAYYAGTLTSNSNVVTSAVNLTNVLTIPAVPYATILDVSWSALLTTNTTATDVLDVALLVNGTAYRYIRGTGINQQFIGNAAFSVAANTQTTLLVQATKASGTGTSTFVVDSMRRWLECTVNPA